MGKIKQGQNKELYHFNSLKIGTNKDRYEDRDKEWIRNYIGKDVSSKEQGHKDVLSQGAYRNCIGMIYEDKDKILQGFISHIKEHSTTSRMGVGQIRIRNPNKDTLRKMTWGCTKEGAYKLHKDATVCEDTDKHH